MLVYLLGLPGVGKTTLGRQISEKLSFNFIDLDAEIEESVGLTIPEVFNHRGEEYFRELEKIELQKTFNYENTIVATGGGTPCFFDNMDQMSSKGVTIYLRSTPEKIVQGLSKDEILARPLFSGEKPLQKIKTLLKERSLYYEKSNYKVEIEENTAEKIVSILS